MKKMCLRWCNLEATILEIHIDSLQNGIELNCPFDEVCAAQAELSSLLLKSYEGGLLLNMFWNASHMRSALEYVLEWCKKVCSGVCLSRYFFYFATVGQFVYIFGQCTIFLSVHVPALQLALLKEEKAKLYTTPPWTCLLRWPINQIERIFGSFQMFYGY